jgi:hypothetical protein
MSLRAEAACRLLVLSAMLAGCRVENVSLEAPPTPPPKGSYGACGSAPSALAHLPGLLPLLAVDEFNLYTATAAIDGSAAQSIWRVPKDGSPPAMLATSPTAITSFHVSVGYQAGDWHGLLWSAAGDPDGGPSGAVWALDLDAGVEASVVVPNRPTPVAAISVNNEVYWAEPSVDNVGRPVEAIMGAPIAGGPPTPIQSVPPFEAPLDMHISAQGLQTAGGAPEFFSEGALFWTTASAAPSAEIIACPLSAPFAPLVRYGGLDAGGAGGINVTAFQIEVSLGGSIATLATTPDGGIGTPQTILSTAGPVEVFADDGTDLYFVQPGTTNLVGVPYFPPDAAAPRTILTDVDPTLRFQVDSACLYLVDTAIGAVMMVAK